MDIQFNQQKNDLSFKSFLFDNRQNRVIILLATICVLLQFGIFKFFYPFASYIHDDSFVYIRAAKDNLDINTHMIGYSKFLRIFNTFISSDTILVAFQYIALQSSALFLLFSIFYFYKTSKLMIYILITLIVLNPLFLHLSNLISSDSLFCALSISWFTSLLWIINKPRYKIIFFHALILFISFTFRYNALIYPIISAFAFSISKSSFSKKLIGIMSGTFLCALFVLYTGNKYKELNGTWQYSPFSGWQLANNAMYAYRYVDPIKRKNVPKRFQKLDNMIRTYFDSTRNDKRFWVEDVEASTFYMWDEKLPLVKYMNLQFNHDTITKKFNRWASMGPLYSEYGRHIIKQYPSYFLRHFLLPNSRKYFALPVEYLALYNDGTYDVSDVAKNWFNYKSNLVIVRANNVKVDILNFYPILNGTMNAVLFCSLLSFIILNGFKRDIIFSKFVLLVTVIWGFNAAFTIIASSAALRFQSFPMFLITISSFMLIDWMIILMNLNIENKPKIDETTKNQLAIKTLGSQ